MTKDLPKDLRRQMNRAMEEWAERFSAKFYSYPMFNKWGDDIKAFIEAELSKAIESTRKELAIKYAECTGCEGTKKSCEWAVKYHNAIACCPDCSHGNSKYERLNTEAEK